MNNVAYRLAAEIEFARAISVLVGDCPYARAAAQLHSMLFGVRLVLAELGWNTECEVIL